jgi:uncharacterized membrane protein
MFLPNSSWSISVDLKVVILRFLHVWFGVFWAGTAIFLAAFLIPAIGDVGPDGGKVMAALERRRLLQVIPFTAIVTVLSGLALMFRVSNGFDPAWSRSRLGMTLSLGALLAITALLIGLTVMRPTANRVSALTASLATPSAGADRQATMATLGQLRARLASSARAVAALLAVAVLCMAIARYM